MTQINNTLVTLRVPKDMKEQLEKMAQADHRSLSDFLRLSIMGMLERSELTKK